ncbi:hypothetical protein F2Q69_00016353 [Brassica cretica]|uniref:Uncharacterized protein n=1 Tax=Brassica cretica TaxID=69181 RepID=A0A8S9R5B5_BRACR|nr:hypothetical protein F2Q69_00016353 [Brassica cretica]
MVPLVLLHPFAYNLPKPAHNRPTAPLTVSSIENQLPGLCPSPGSILAAHGPIVSHELPARPGNRSAPATLVRTGTLRQAEMSWPPAVPSSSELTKSKLSLSCLTSLTINLDHDTLVSRSHDLTGASPRTMVRPDDPI